MNDLISRKAVLQIIEEHDYCGHISGRTDFYKQLVAELPTIPQVICDDDCEHCSWVECPLVYKESEEE